MASIADMCWRNSEELFSDLDLEDLYFRQLSVVGAGSGMQYPYTLLIHTGKITLAVHLENRWGCPDDRGRLTMDEDACQFDELTLWKLLRESSE